MGVLLIIPPAPSIAHMCRQSIDCEMFAKEELLENPDDSNCASTKTPRTRSRKRTRSGQSMSDTPERRRDNDKEVASAQPLGKTKMLNKKERSQIVTSIKKCTILEEITKYFQKCDSSIFDELVSRKDILPSLIEFHRQTFISLYEGNGTGRDKYISFQLQWHAFYCYRSICQFNVLFRHLQIQWKQLVNYG